MFSAVEESSLARVLVKRLRSCMPLASMSKDQRQGVERYSKHKPWPKQEVFLSLDCEEAFYGGAAAGGKSDALLMAALQFAHVPGYSALILRRDFARLSLAGAIMDRAKEWLMHRGDVTWSGQDKTFTFASGARLQFGYIDHPDDRFRYASAEYQFIGWDELTEFRLSADEEDETNPYLFMFSRLRKTNDIEVPLRVRSASNPGNIGHAWVKKRFIPPDFRGIKDGDPPVLDVYGRKFVPARIKDNPAIDESNYRAKLANLPPVTRERLMAGDWSVAESLQIPEAWLLPYTMRGEHLVCPDGTGIDSRECLRFATVDTAGTSKDKAEESRGKPPSFSVVAVWDYWRKANRLFLRHVWRDRVDWGELKLRTIDVLSTWGKPRAYIENAHVGPPLQSELRTAGIPTELVGPMLPGMADGYRGAKLERAIASGLLSRLEAGKLLIPADAPWRPGYVAELTAWTGNPDETADQIDVSSYAAWKCKQSASTWGGVIR